MPKLLLIARKEYLERVRTRAFMVGTILGPIGMIALMVGPSFLAHKSGVGERKLVVIDQSSDGIVSALQAELARESAKEPAPAGGDVEQRGAKRRGERGRGSDMAARSHIEAIPYAGNPSDLDAAQADLAPKVKQRTYDGYLVLPPNILDAGQATFYGDDLSSVVWLDVVEGALERVLAQRRLANLGLDQAELARITRGVDVQKLSLDQQKQGSLELRMVAGFVMIMMLYIMILMYGQYSLTGVIEDKTSRVVEVMLASVSPSQLMMGKLIGNGLVGVTQFAIWGLFAFAAAGQATRFVPENVNLAFLTPALWAYFVVFFVLGYILYSSLYAAAGALCNTLQDAQQIVWPITIFVVIPVALLQVVIQDPDATHNVVLSLIPFFTPILMFMRIVMGKPPLWQPALGIVLLLLTVLLMSRVTGKLFRLGILMYGKSPTWGQIMKMLREAD